MSNKYAFGWMFWVAVKVINYLFSNTEAIKSAIRASGYADVAVGMVAAQI
jgi:hypothetical protein